MGYHTYRYYHPELDRDGSRRLLTTNGVGSYLVRPSSRRGCLSLSVHAQQRIAHFLIYVTGDDDDEKFQLDPKAWTGHEIKGRFYPALHQLLLALGRQRNMAATFKKGIPRGSEHAEKEPPMKLYSDQNLEILKPEGHVGVSGDEDDYADADIEDDDEDFEDSDDADVQQRDHLGLVVRQSPPPPLESSSDSDMHPPEKEEHVRSAPSFAASGAGADAVVHSIPSNSSNHGKRSMRRKKKPRYDRKPVGGSGRATPVPSSAPPQKPNAPSRGGRQARRMPPSPAEVRANDQASRMTAYKAMLSMCITDGHVSAKELQKLSTWRQKQNFSHEMHLQALAFLHIKPEEFEAMKDFSEQPDASKEQCVVCMDKPRDCVILTCKHMITCYDCGKQLKDCPTCRNPIKEIVKFYK